MNKGVHVGWQAACKLDEHIVPAPGKCCRSRNFIGGGSTEHEVLRKLKWWLLQGNAVGCDEKEKHCKDIPDVPIHGRLPSMRSLDGPSGHIVDGAWIED